jgi:hypothetical protein
MKKGTYNSNAFRTITHGLHDENAYCRHCKWSKWGLGAGRKGRYHAKKTLHTVDVYREHWTEHTSWVKPK